MEDGQAASRVGHSEVVVAETVFLLMTKEHRISKHLRAKWYLKHVNTIMDFPYSDNVVGHPKLVSVLVNGGIPLQPGPDGHPVQFKLATDTTVNFLSTHHDLVFALDISFSAISSSTADSEVLFDKMFDSLQKCVIGLTKTFIIPGSDVDFVPNLYATVIAYYPLENCPVQQVLTHGYPVSHCNVREFLQYINVALNKFENGVASYLSSLLSEACLSRKSSVTSSILSIHTEDSAEEEALTTNSLRKYHLSPEKGFFHLIKNAMLAIHLLPTNCSSGIIVLTDGNVGIGDVGRYDNLLVQLLSQSCTCSILEIQYSKSEKRGLGRVPHSEMLQFIATATFGAYFNETPCMDADLSQQMNVYHAGVLCWDFRKSIKDFLSIGLNVSSLAYENKLRKTCTGYQLHVPINCVITTRLKEGFTIKTVDASKDSTRRRNFREELSIEVVMVLPWRKNICIEYKAGSVWPVPPKDPITNVDICFEGNYHFLHDLTCKKSHTNNNTATKYRQSLVNRFWKSMLGLKPIDESLVKMQSFHTEDVYSTIPDSIKKGVALFYFSNVNNGRTIEVINPSKDIDIDQFASYWRRVLCIDLGVPLDKSGVTFDRSSHIMEKWFHITRLYMVLEHDPKHPEMLNITYYHDRYHTLQCRQASQALTKTLREWSDFELLENSHFVKYINRQDDDSTPISGYHAENWRSFCMIIITVKGACVTLRLTFLGGTDSIYRTRLINELKDVVQSLHFQKRPERSSYSTAKIIRNSVGDETVQHIPPLQRKWEDRQCCILLTKPLDRVLVRYERIPKKLLTVDNINQDISPVEGVPSRLANYLLHQRWIWYLQPSGDNANFEPLDMRCIGNILNVLTKLRLQEGFNFSHTNSGIVSMILEVDMTSVQDGVETTVPKGDQESLSCLVQYVTFPPQRRARVHDSMSEGEVDDDSADSYGELTMVTEVWIEPQHGFVTNSTPERLHYDGCTFADWPDKLYPVDKQCITLLVTLDHLLKFCCPLNRTSMSSSLVSGRLEPLLEPGDLKDVDDTSRVEQIPFVFSVIELLPMCQQVETLLPAYHSVSKEMGRGSGDASNKTNDLLFEYLLAELDKHQGAYEMELTNDECAKFMKQIQERSRDITAEKLPFNWSPVDQTLLQDASVHGTDQDCVTSTAHSSARGTSDYLSSYTDRISVGKSDSPSATLNRTSPSTTLPVEDAPDLKCYCFPGNADKSGAIESVTILFMPASYKDLKKMCSGCSKEDGSESVLHSTEGIINDAAGSHFSDELSSEPLVPPLNLDDTESEQNSTSAGDRSLPLPIYMYHCSRPVVVDALVNNNIHCIKADEYNDLRFSPLTEVDGGREHRISYRSDKSDESERISPLASRRRNRTDSGCSRRSFSRAASVDGSTSALSNTLTMYCEDIFYKSFITGIFQSLQLGYEVSSKDVEFAIEISMENDIHEVDITNFLRHVCSHMTCQTVQADALADQVFADVTTPTTAKSVKFEIPGLTDKASPSDSDQFKSQNRSSGSSSNVALPSNLRSPISMRVPCAALFERKCETVVSAERIKAKFAEVIGNWFKPIPSCKDVYYYAPNNLLSNQMSVNGPESEDIEMFETCDDEASALMEAKRRLYSKSISEESRESMPSLTDNLAPLFIHLTASVRDERVNQSVLDIPVCIRELREGFKNRETIDLSSPHITLDIICLTLPNEFSEQSGGLILEEDEDIATLTAPASVEESFDNTAKEMREMLSVTQHNDIMDCQRHIEWLVRDEIAAAMRCTGPITENTLRIVAEHVKGGQNEKSCKYAKERLSYVFGPEISHDMFIEEFERMNVTGYQLIKNGGYYYLSIDRARLRTMSTQKSAHDSLDHEAVVHKLDEINNSPHSTHFDHSMLSGSKSPHEFDRSIEILPDQLSTKGSLARVSSLPGSKLDSVEYLPSRFQRPGGNIGVKSISDGDSSDGIELIIEDEAVVGPGIPISGARAEPRQQDEEEEIESAAAYREKLSSLPQANRIDEWNTREDDEFSSKCGSLPKAFSSCNVNLERSSERKILKRVSSGPQDLHSESLIKPKIRHVSEGTGRKRATFAISVLSPPPTSNTVMSMKECLELEASRSRNPSGPWTPASNRLNGSTGSGYEADQSDDEGTGGGLSLIDLGSRKPLMPDFWLIMQVHSDQADNALKIEHIKSDYRVDVYFHTSETVQPERHFSDSVKGNVPKHKLFGHVLSEIRRTCKLVNQRLLLRDLYNKRKCNLLLEEDWDDEPFQVSDSNHNQKPGSADSDGDGEHKSDEEYLFARTEFEHGHFKCDLQWEKVIQLHPRLRSGKSKQSANRGLIALRSGLSNLAITNRTNMFVHKESPTGNIFYLRLSECDPLSTPRNDYPDDVRTSAGVPTLLSRSSSVRSMSKLREEEETSRRASVTDYDDTQSIASSRISTTVRRHNSIDDGVKISVYGIDAVGTDIEVELVKMLEARLDKTVLNEIETLLSRNTNCMLTPQDVQFLQKKEPSTISLTLSLPDEILHHQKAVLHYLRQNLLLPDLLFHPKYHDPDRRFLDYTESLDNALPMADCNTFLYNRSPAYHNAEKGAGLALIYLQLVDNSNHPKTLLDSPCPKPDPEAWRTLDSSMFARLTSVSKVTLTDNESRTVSTSSYIRFSIWSRGKIDLEGLEAQLTTCLVHSLCDFVCEYYALTAPLCEAPADLVTEAASISSHEEQLSLVQKGSVTPTGLKTFGGKRQALTKSKSTATSAFSFNLDHVKMRNQVTSPSYMASDGMGESGSDSTNSKKTLHPTLVEIDKYKFGEKGHLLPFYTTTLVDWLEYCSTLGVPALTKVSCGLLNECIVDPIMKEFELVVNELRGVSIQAFKLIDQRYVPYQTSRAPLPESAQTEGDGLFKHLNFPYSNLSHGHILTVRNRRLWIDSIGDSSDDRSSRGVPTPITGSMPSVPKDNQKFPPAYAGMEGSLNLSSSQASFLSERQLIPRQQFLMLVIKNGELILYSYNLADGKDDVFQHIIQNTKKITRWNNARFHLLNSVAHQKMGLFQHASIQEIPKERHCEERNLYTSTYEDTCLLVKSSRPESHKPQISRPGARLNKPVVTQGALDMVYRGCKPTRPMHLSKTGLERDPIVRHGSQLIETHKNELRDAERIKKLDKLHKIWLERMGPVRTEISEDQLDLLKQSSRLVHHVATPLLLSPHWRIRAMNLPRTEEELKKTDEVKKSVHQRSRNDSGASGRSSVAADRVAGMRDSPISIVTGTYEEETWHEEMRNMFVSNYIDYLGQTQQPLGQLGFTTIKVTTHRPSHRGFSAHHRKHSSGGSGCEQLVRRRTTNSLQKTMKGGIFLIELSFQEVYFVVKLYVFSASQLSVNKQPDQKSRKAPASYFIEMCDRMRDNTHCHSFAYDFHLRAVHRYVKGSRDYHSAKEFHNTYHLVDMLRSFALYYDEAPRYSRNALALELMQQDSSNNPCDKLFGHILLYSTHEAHHRMTQIDMSDNDEDEYSCDHGLVFNPPNFQDLNKKYGEYEASVIVAHDHPTAYPHIAMKDKLNLIYFVVLVNVNKEQQYPLDVAENFFVDISRLEKLSADSAISSSPCGMGYSLERRTSDQFTDSLLSKDGATHDQYNHPAHQLLSDHCNAVRETLTTLVKDASLLCRKKSLWAQMFPTQKEQAKHSATDLSTQSDNVELLTFEEFKELLDHVHKQPMTVQDELLATLNAMPMSWFQSLTKMLSIRYHKNYREFVRKDGQVIHAVVFVPELEDDVVLLLSIDSENMQADLLLMFSDDDTEAVTTDENFTRALEVFINTLCFHMWSQMAQ